MKNLVWGQDYKQASKHMHVHNAVILVWGSLRLAPIKVLNSHEVVTGATLAVRGGLASFQGLKMRRRRRKCLVSVVCACA